MVRASSAVLGGTAMLAALSGGYLFFQGLRHGGLDLERSWNSISRGDYTSEDALENAAFITGLGAATLYGITRQVRSRQQPRPALHRSDYQPRELGSARKEHNLY